MVLHSDVLEGREAPTSLFSLNKGQSFPSILFFPRLKNQFRLCLLLSEVQRMKKSGKRFCDRCKAEIPKEKQTTDNVHDIIKLGFYVGSCQTMNWAKDMCTDCADEFDKWWKNELVQ